MDSGKSKSACGIELDAEGRITAFDDAAAELFGVAAPAAIGRPFKDLAIEALSRERAGRKAALEELEAFAYSVSHDLRAPVRHVEGFAALLESESRDRLSGESLHFLEVIVKAARRMNGLLEGMLAYSRAGRAELRTGPVDMAALARDALAEVQRRIPERNIAWSVSELPACRGDRVLLRQLWLAVLENAAKFTGKAEAAAVSVGAENVDGEIEYCVRDNGAGLDSNYAGKLFKLFQRVHHDSEFEGLGVGLAVAHRIVARHGGSIRIEGAVGEGARVSFRLPA